MPDGIFTAIKGKRIRQWIGFGGGHEDVPCSGFGVVVCRSKHHFHNPLKPWDQAGFSWPLFPDGESSVRWAQEPNQLVGGKWSWFDGRRYFYEALTTPSPSEREQAWAKTFQALGQVIHLVQDASVPAHSRNDFHPTFNYELWVERVRQREGAKFDAIVMSPHFPDLSILTLPPNPLASIPIAKFWDTDLYDGSNPEVTGSAAIGLSEYSNANFLSEDTQYKGFPFPAKTSVEQRPDLIPDPRDPTRLVIRLYDWKVADGDTGYRLATVGAVRKYVTTHFPEESRRLDRPGLDARVYEDYMRRLLPRAVGYSAALLDYFFRGRIEARLGNGTLEVLNASEEPLGPGTLALYYDDDAGMRRLAAEWSIDRVLPGGQLSLAAGLPPAPTGYMLAFRGTLGGELDAVIGKMVQPEQYLFFEQLSYHSLADGQDPLSFTDWCGNFFYYTAYWPTSIHITGRLHKSPGVEVLKIEVAPVEASDVTYDRNSQSVTIHFAPRLFKPAALIITTDAPVPNPQGFDYPFPNKYVYSQPAGPDDFFPVEGTGSQRATTIYFPLAFPGYWETYGSSIPASCSNRPGESQSNAYIVYGDFSLAPVAGTHRLLTGGYTGYDWESVGEGPQYSRLGAVVEWYIDNGVVDPPGALTEPKVTVEHYYKYFEEKGPEGLKAALPRSSFSVNLLE